MERHDAVRARAIIEPAYVSSVPLLWSMHTHRIYTAVCKNFEPLIYISIYIYEVHCGKVLVLENIPGHKIINM